MPGTPFLQMEARHIYVDLTWDDLGKKGYTYEFFGMPASDFEDLHYKYLPNYKRNR